ncbi:Cyclin-H1-1 [Phytophthora nicotianae]|uniref:Cyclin-H1-1 n=1 Tax=Phytophthora nicotianae TaxID=4792 RepID=A0A0W8DJV4_PHYNI|nr:Cyclin-H1-1 [Phytophthora nicotianae]
MLSEPIRFTPVQLYENEREDLIKLAHEQYKTLFRNVRFAQANGFATQVRAFARTTRATVCAETRIHATIPELVDVFLGDRTNAAIGFAQSQQIYRFLAPTDEHPYRSCGMRWSLWHSPSTLIRQRDIVYLEYMDTFVDERGRRGWARMTQSLEHRSCPPLMGSHNVVRAFLHCCGTVYTETDDPKVLEAVTYYDADTQGVPPWMTKIVANRKAKNPHNLEHLIRHERGSKFGLEEAFELQRRRKLNRICVHCVDDFLARTNRQLELTLPSSVSFQSDDVSTPGSLSGRFMSIDSVEVSTIGSTTLFFLKHYGNAYRAYSCGLGFQVRAERREI